MTSETALLEISEKLDRDSINSPSDLNNVTEHFSGSVFLISSANSDGWGGAEVDDFGFEFLASKHLRWLWPLEHRHLTGFP